MWGKIFVIFSLFVMCYCQNHNFSNVHLYKKKHHYDPYLHHLLVKGAILYYLTFILIKFKVAFVIGVLITIFMVAGKFFALIKFSDYMKGESKSHEPEKIFLAGPSHPPHIHHSPISYSPHDDISFSPNIPGDSWASNSMPIPVSSNIPIIPGDSWASNGMSISNQYYDRPPPQFQAYEKSFRQINHR